ncbi:hypothetical protein PMAYCL1PPCAC_06319, partial [Pristionchus mayeri]
RVVRRRLMTSLAPDEVRMHGVGVHFHSMAGWDKCATYEGTMCGAAAHAVILALSELLKHPDDLDVEWRVETRCRYLVEAVQTGSTSASMCNSCQYRGNPEHAAAVRRLIARFPRRVQLDVHVERDETARRLAFMGIRRLYGTGDSDCSDGDT